MSVPGVRVTVADGIARLMKEQAVYAYRFEGKRYDCGSKLGYLQATVEYALNHSSLGTPFRNYLHDLMGGTAASPPKPAKKVVRRRR